MHTFSLARGGKPCSDQSRASACHILRWAEALYRALPPGVLRHRDARPVSSPIGTLTRDRYALVEPNRATLDIRFRMLQPHELVKAELP